MADLVVVEPQLIIIIMTAVGVEDILVGQDQIQGLVVLVVHLIQEPIRISFSGWEVVMGSYEFTKLMGGHL